MAAAAWVRFPVSAAFFFLVHCRRVKKKNGMKLEQGSAKSFRGTFRSVPFRLPQNSTERRSVPFRSVFHPFRSVSFRSVLSRDGTERNGTELVSFHGRGGTEQDGTERNGTVIISFR